ncbi:phosphoglycerol transferase MdoB-like AlkP superfamily enzyme [Elusimicrobium posterum]|uniref:LTA synthase family protein n=1 Tax=Elusimicrobium posterum TaxID=3116653 RepID=UPI003C721E96
MKYSISQLEAESMIVSFIFDFFKDAFKQNFKLLAVLSLPGVILTLYGFLQLGVFTPGVIIIGLLQKFFIEFFFLGTCLYALRLLGLTNKWVYSVLFFVYLILCSCDATMLMYFKERFGSKYFGTLEGGDYNFLKDYRIVTLLLIYVAYSILPIRKWLGRMSKPQALDGIAKSLIFFLCFSFIPFSGVLSERKSFYVKYLMPPSPVYMIKCMLAGGQKPLTSMDTRTAESAKRLGLFEHKKTEGLAKYDRIILLTTEAMSNKFIGHFNPGLPQGASPTLDGLLAKYPYTVLNENSLSTLYGLSIVFSGHPNSKLSYENDYPLSFVRVLKDNGFKTAFIRGADEHYMDEDVLFKKAGFEEIYGSNYFSEQDKYKDSVAWWGLTDRKLFDFTADYLKENKNKKLFLHILTVDTHVPLGRADYLNQQYPAAPEDKIYAQVNMPRAFFRHDYDLGLFIERLEKENIMDERTLLIITGDHPFYNNLTFNKLVKPYKESYDHLPLIFVSKKPLGLKPVRDNFASQTDIAPTILDLAGFNAEKGMFGKTLFQTADRTVFSIKEDYFVVKNKDGKTLNKIKNPASDYKTAVINTFIEE